MEENSNNNDNADNNKNKKKVTRIKNAQARPIFLVQGLRDGRTPDQVRKRTLDTNCIVIFLTLEQWKSTFEMCITIRLD